MGARESKTNESLSEINRTNCNNEISTPTIKVIHDPRSPNKDICRTPLQLPIDDPLKSTTLQKLLDPRSPSTEIIRTPIVINQIVDKPENKHLKNVRTTVMPPKLLESSPITTNTNSIKRKSFIGLLETNIDYTETDLDKVNLNKLFIEESQEQTEDEQLEESFGTDLDEIPPETEVKEQLEDVVEAKIKPTTHPIIDITATVENLDKKLSDLIYEDNDDNSGTPSKKNSNNNDKGSTRTPLGVRNVNNAVKKPTRQLKVKDKPRKSETSKIPVFKSGLAKKMNLQCENTPPDHLFNNKKSQWDPDTSLVI